MPKIAISQRVDVYPERGERRDAVDQRWFNFIEHIGYTAIPLPNYLPAIRKILSEIDFCGLVLTGGNDLSVLGGDAPERDTAEQFMMNHFIERQKPVLAICRGMQLFLHSRGARIERITGHAGTRHAVTGRLQRSSVASFHSWGCQQQSLPDNIQIIALSQDGYIEACHDEKEIVLGLMWHPEREDPYNQEDIDIIKKFFSREACL